MTGQLQKSGVIDTHTPNALLFTTNALCSLINPAWKGEKGLIIQKNLSDLSLKWTERMELIKGEKGK